MPRNVRWGLILLAGTAAGVLPIALPILLINLYAAVLQTGRLFLGGDTVGDRVMRFAYFMGEWGVPALHLLLVAGVAFWMSRRSGKLQVVQGICIGVVAAVAGQLVILFYAPPISPSEVALMLALSVAGGALGGYEGRRTLEYQEAVYRTGQGLAAARHPQAVADTIGRHLAGPGVSAVTLWQTAREPGDGIPGEPEFLAAWVPESAEEGSGTPELDGAWVRAVLERSSGSPETVRVGSLPGAVRAALKKRGVRSALVIPLSAPGGAFAGLLAVFSRRPGFSQGAARRYRTAGTQAGLALENQRLLEEARRTGRQAGVLKERQRLAHEIHDTLAQGFTSIVMNLEAADQSLYSEPEQTHRSLSHARRIARESLSEARRLVRALRPEQLEDASLAEALGRLAARFSEESGITATATVTGEARPLARETEAVFLRVAQEALANVRKHSRASRAALTLSFMPDLLTLDARDDGVGFDPTANTLNAGYAGGFGLQGMRERIQGIGGTLSVESAPGEGATITAELPSMPVALPGSSSYQTSEEIYDGR